MKHVHFSLVIASGSSRQSSDRPERAISRDRGDRNSRRACEEDGMCSTPPSDV